MKSTSEQVKKISLLVLIDYAVGQVKGQGIVFGEGAGYDLSDVNIVGKVGVVSGGNLLFNPSTSVATSTYLDNYI